MSYPLTLSLSEGYPPTILILFLGQLLEGPNLTGRTDVAAGMGPGDLADEDVALGVAAPAGGGESPSGRRAARQWAALSSRCRGGTVMGAPGERCAPELIWRLVGGEKVNSIAIVGDAMGRPLAEALAQPGASYDTSSMFVIGSGGASFSDGVKDQLREQLPKLLLLATFCGSEGCHQGPGCGGLGGSSGDVRACDSLT